MADRFFIGPMVGGKQTNLKPWMISDQAYEVMENIYEWRGRLKKRPGSLYTGSSQLTSRMRILIGTTNGSGALGATNLPLNTGDMAIGMMFSIGEECYTITALGNPATLLATDSAVLTVNTTASPATISITGAAATTEVYFYPALPIMGIATYDQIEQNAEDTIVFDTRFAYEYDSIGWNRFGTGLWSGDDTNYVWTCNYLGAERDDYLLFAVNYNGSDGIQYYDSSTSAWASLTAEDNSGSGNFILSARIVIPFQDRLLLLNTIETDGTFTARMRYCKNGDPTDTDAWYQTSNGDLGGYLDATTRESIISAAFLENRLLVYFENSTWEIVFTGSQKQPFVWQKINAELGAESPFATVNMDKYIFGFGSRGLHTTNGTQVERIDNNIPDEVFNISYLNDGPLRVAGIRDFFNEMIYWAVPLPQLAESGYNTQIIAYNYRSGTFANFNGSYTAFGYFRELSNLTWQEAVHPWNIYNQSWSSFYNTAQQDIVLAGNQQGFVVQFLPDINFNIPNLSITDIALADPVITITCINHNLQAKGFFNPSAYIQFKTIESTGTLATRLNDKIFPIISTPDDNTFTIEWDIDDEDFPTGAYTGCGTISLVSPIVLYSKQYNFYNKEGCNLSIDKIDFNVDKTPSGAITIDAAPSFSDVSTIEDGQQTDAILGNNVLETYPYPESIAPFEQEQKQLWHSIYPQLEGSAVQIRVYHSPEQTRDPEQVNVAFTLNGVMYYARKTSSRFQ